MSKLSYTIIKNIDQYTDYCSKLESLVMDSNQNLIDEIELLTLLIEKWDSEHNSFNELDPIMVLHYLMNENKLKSKDLCVILDLSKSTVSKILNYQKGLSKDSIRRLAEHFKLSQAIFNKAYKLKQKYESMINYTIN